MLGHGTFAAVDATRSRAREAREEAAESFDQLLGERSSRQLDTTIAGLMVTAADHAVIVADTFQVLVDMGYTARDGDHRTERVDGQAVALVASRFMLAERIEGLGAARTVPLNRDELRQAALDYLAAWAGDSSRRGQAAIAVAWTREWLEQLDELVRQLEGPAAKVAASAAAPWWK